MKLPHETELRPGLVQLEPYSVITSSDGRTAKVTHIYYTNILERHIENYDWQTGDLLGINCAGGVTASQLRSWMRSIFGDKITIETVKR